MAIKVILIDDREVIRDGISLLLEKYENIDLIGSAENEVELYDLLKTTAPDILLMDITMPDKDGIALCKEVHKTYPNIRIIGLSMHEHDVHMVGMLRAGAAGYILKGAKRSEIIEAIEDVYVGNYHFSKDIPSKIVETFLKKHGTKIVKNQTELLLDPHLM